MIIIKKYSTFILLYYATVIIQLAVSAYGNEISITIDAMKTTLIAKNMVQVCAKRSLRRSWKAVQRGLLNCFLRHPPAPEVVPTSIQCKSGENKLREMDEKERTRRRVCPSDVALKHITTDTRRQNQIITPAKIVIE